MPLMSSRTMGQEYCTKQQNTLQTRYTYTQSRHAPLCQQKKVTISDVEGNKYRGRPWLNWMDGIKRALGERGCQWMQSKQHA